MKIINIPVAITGAWEICPTRFSSVEGLPFTALENATGHISVNQYLMGASEFTLKTPAASTATFDRSVWIMSGLRSKISV